MTIAILLSGGTGTRLGAEIPKQYLRIADRMIITYSLKTLLEHSEIDGVLIVAELEWRERILTDIKHLEQNTNKIISFAVPGVTRQFSIFNALQEVKKINFEVKNILIHDAARPNLATDMITKCVVALKENDGVLPVLPMKDTIYYSENGSSVSQLLDRSRLFAGQAPEGFRFQEYYKANQSLLPNRLKEINGSTEPAVLAGMDVAMIAGDENNFKITTKADLERFRIQVEGVEQVL